ncbi:hypothetical protein GRS96_04155 [Rathayibacter sp. VKM Ac-2803]|uniref:NfeD family protein n=1 Tax=Rathayibacter sp. VKM Ac-2803 TaxID=2609256 RepID=UPI00135B637A|nr:NfeD family protein [Rathayibacter sp. VKM Ac-2803]MWV48468.1 hypothetical protein [Rathayibacter sp. VKM Ac-2803]
MITFIVVGVAGLLMLLVSVVVGDVLERVGGSALSGTALGIAATLFGAAGVLTMSLALPTAVAYAAAFVAAVASYLIVLRLTRRIVGGSDGGTVAVIGLHGIATASISVRGGEVSLDGPGEVERCPAYSEEPIPEGTRIRVIEQAGTRVKVERESFGV